MKKEIKVKVEYSAGYEKRFTKACLEQIEKRKSRESAGVIKK